MTARPPMVPGANSPQRLTRLLEAVGRGVRTTRGLQEALGVQSQTVRAYVQAARWLDLAGPSDPVALTPLGLEFVYAGVQRPLVYLRAVWANRLAARLLSGSIEELPDHATVVRAIWDQDPDLADATVQRRASAVRSLIAPAVGHPPPRGRPPPQLALPLCATPDDDDDRPLRDAGPHDADAYRWLWIHLLDHGELSLRQIRALLDRAGGAGVPLDDLLETAIGRGDGVQIGDRLVATAHSLDRRALVDSTLSVILSDHRYRRHLDRVLAGCPPDLSFAAWDRRLFGGPPDPRTLHQDLGRVLLERPLAAYPITSGTLVAPPRAPAPFIRVWQTPDLPIALPPTLAALSAEIPALAASLAEEGALPTVMSARRFVHGGLVHPGEAPPTAIDADLLRRRALTCAPGPCLATALLLIHRQRPNRVAVVDTPRGPGVRLRNSSGSPKPLIPFLEAFSRSMGWQLIRRSTGGLTAEALLRGMAAMGLCRSVAAYVVLDESLFIEVTRDPREDAAGLRELSDALDGWLDEAARA